MHSSNRIAPPNIIATNINVPHTDFQAKVNAVEGLRRFSSRKVWKLFFLGVLDTLINRGPLYMYQDGARVFGA